MTLSRSLGSGARDLHAVAARHCEHVLDAGRAGLGERSGGAKKPLDLGRLAERGHPEVRYAHGSVFQFLDDGGTRVSLLASRAQVSKQAMAQLVAHLEEHGYVERVPDPGDRRAQLVCSTARGRAVFAVARELVTEVDAQLDERLGAAKVKRLRSLLLELNEAL